MEKRIKIVWILSLVSALVLIAVQCYWLYTQYRYAMDSYCEEVTEAVLSAGEEEYAIRKEEKGDAFAYSIKRDSEFSFENEKGKRKTTMSFVSGDPEKISNKRINQLLDSVSQLVEKEDIGELLQDKKEDVRILIKDSGQQVLPANGNLPREETFPKETLDSFNLTFRSDMPEDSIIIGMNRAFVNRVNPFRQAIMDSLLQVRLPDVTYSYAPWEITDTLYYESFREKSGTLLRPAVNVYYAYSPFQRLGVKIGLQIPVQPVFGKMAAQLLLSFGLVLLLLGCLIFQIKTILKQRKVGEMRQHFVNTMIHELKRPVQTLKTFVSFLGDREMRTDEQMTEQIVQDSMFELDNLSAYLNKLKDMVRADDESTPLHISRFNLFELADKVIRLTHIPTGKQATFTTQFEMESPFIEADPIHVANILSNLIENAIKYSGDNVEITVNARRKANDLWLTVSDNGIGIPLVEQDKVFAKFYRGSNMPDLTIPGLGLGLSYVKLISEAHHGSVSLSSNLGQGTSVTLYLPQ